MGLQGYDINELNSEEGLRYYFISSGRKEIYKIIDYGLLEGIRHDIIKTNRIFNFGFGDLDENFEIVDDEFSNNGDTRRVFYTVLNTIPYFLKKYPNEAIAISGSDSTKSFTKRRFKHCIKHGLSADQCKNKHRRILVYMAYVNKNYDDLIKEYNFFGAFNNRIEIYEKSKKYETVCVCNKERFITKFV